ncbi:hypothetical protein HS088_TW22G00161 [Tripterygium wilfordii]|uniref:DUF1664 domain-containing protein n=1 Tax=Tripterygium wilfordii TaxID=458696 RepID=A0A7J7BX80_TRIWF|nr:uncharacterized protein LOC119990725 [Tripterygium wilfordii]KAF5726483.1 hypothetical protein HS088_TW22G00161 [Tripterygium wilfordii]
MALQTGVSTSKVLILVGAGLTSSVVLRSGRLSDLIAQLQDLLKGVDEVEISPQKIDTAFVAAQIRQLAKEIKELSSSSPVTIYNGSSSSTGNFSSYLVPAAALGAVGYCYMWWKGWSLSDVMFVTKHNMANAVTTVSKQLELVSETLASTRRHLSKRLENLDWKVEEQRETSNLIANNVNEMKSNLSEIGYDVEMIHKMVSTLEGKLELLENKQDSTNSGLWYLCNIAGGLKDGINSKLLQDGSTKLADHPTVTYEESPLKGLQFIAGADETGAVEKLNDSSKKRDLDSLPGEKVQTLKTRIHRSYPVGISLAPELLGSGI